MEFLLLVLEGPRLEVLFIIICCTDTKMTATLLSLNIVVLIGNIYAKTLLKAILRRITCYDERYKIIVSLHDPIVFYTPNETRTEKENPACSCRDFLGCSKYGLRLFHEKNSLKCTSPCDLVQFSVPNGKTIEFPDCRKSLLLKQRKTYEETNQLVLRKLNSICCRNR
jgi:hypothetical protein